MFDIEGIELDDFRSFAGKHTFKFPTAPGLYGITGNNLANPRLGPNGVGKSTLLEAIFWCLYGHTTRGLKAGDVVNWGAKSCAVSVALLINENPVKVRRTQSPNSLTLDGNPVDQITLQKALRIGPEAFTYAVCLPQHGTAFFELSPGDKLTLFSQLMELDYWLDKSKEADALAKELLAEKFDLEKKRSSCEGQLSAVAADALALAPKRDAFAEEQKQTIRLIIEDINKAKAGLSTSKNLLKQDGHVLEGLEQKHITATKRGLELNGQRDQLEAKAKRLYAEESVTENRLSTVNATLKRLEGLDAECPTCLQKVSRDHLSAERTRWKRQKQTIMAELEACVDGVASAASVLDKLLTAIDKCNNDVKAIAHNISDFEKGRQRLRSEIGFTEASVKAHTAAMIAEEGKVNPYVQLLEEKRETRATLKGQIEAIKQKIEQVDQDHVAVSYWVIGFKRVRLFIVEQTLRQLELEINNSLTSLGLLDWHIELDVERENKSGGITKGFTVLVHAPGAPGAVKFEAWSGGETQRLCLAGDLGLASLIMERAGLTSTIEFFDEPSRHLSQEGMLDLADTLQQRAIAQNKRCFVIEHNLLDYSYRRVITVTKDADGSHIELN